MIIFYTTEGATLVSINPLPHWHLYLIKNWVFISTFNLFLSLYGETFNEQTLHLLNVKYIYSIFIHLKILNELICLKPWASPSKSKTKLHLNFIFSIKSERLLNTDILYYGTNKGPNVCCFSTFLWIVLCCFVLHIQSAFCFTKTAVAHVKHLADNLFISFYALFLY